MCGPRATCRYSATSASMRWSWAPCWPISTHTPMRRSSPLPYVSASPTFTTALSRQRHLSNRIPQRPSPPLRGETVSCFAAAVTRRGGDWVGTEVDLTDVEDLDGVVHVLR